ncbi:MAG TPA: HAMP domain-containing sensor histidine kinase [Candidatus Angelobacter sp.]|nr:HAMP domain-containing sensor histidine kinase [Candidatus Angelobacter sp.]
MFNLPPIKPSRLLWTLLFLGALLVLVNGTVIYAIQTAHRFLDEELGKRFEATAHTAALLVQADQLDALFPGTADSLRADVETTMDAVEAADAVRERWRRLADGAGASNILLLDPDHKVVLALRESTAREAGRATLDEAAFARAMIGEAAHSRLFVEGATYLKAGYAPVTQYDGRIVGAVVVEGGSGAFRPLVQMRASLYSAAILASILVVLVGLGYVRLQARLAHMEERMNHADLLATVGQVAAGVAHEIRNPLGVMRGALPRLQRQDLSVDERNELLGMMDEEVDRMGDVVQNFLDLSKRPDTQDSALELRPLLERSMEILKAELERCSVRSSVQWEADSGLEIRGRQQALHHLFLNLALNARDAMMPKGGELTVLVQQRKSEVRIYFQDSGPGIPRSIRSKIFEPFFTTRAEGTGLGLAFVDRIVTEHGGSISVGSSPSGGAQFQIHLPIES